MSKGSNSRPIPDRDKYEDNWDKIFSKPIEEEKSMIPHNNFERDYLQLVSRILALGEVKETRNATTKSLFAQTLVIDDLEKGRFPILTSRKMFTKGILGELAAFMRSPTHVDDFKTYGCNYWDKWADEKGNLTLDYGRDWAEQFGHVIKSIKEGGTDRRMLVNTWNSQNLEDLSLPCCHYSYQFYVRGGFVDILWNQRSADVMVGVPSDIVLAATMLIALADEVGLKPGKITMMFGDTHIYEPHWKNAYWHVKRDIMSLPTYQYDSLGGMLDFEPGCLSLDNYIHAEPIKYELIG